MKSKSRKQSNFHKKSIIIDNARFKSNFLLFFQFIKFYRILKFKLKKIFKKNKIKEKYLFLKYNENIKVNITRQISNNVFSNKSMNKYLPNNQVIYEPFESSIINHQSHKHDYFFDIGSHQGYYAFIACNKVKEVHAFEPLNLFYNEIKYHIKINNIKNIILHKTALGNNDHLQYGNFLEIRKFKTMKLDNFLNNKKFDGKILLKIDVDGFENYLIEGFKKHLDKNKFSILIDFYPLRINEKDSFKIISHLIKLYNENS